METLAPAGRQSGADPGRDEEVYDEAVKQMGNEQEVRARHILVPTEDEAKAVLAEIKKGTDFAELAKQKSKDPGAAAEGGDLGYFGRNRWCRSSPKRRSRWTRARCPIRSRRNSAGTSSGRGQAHQAGAGVRQGEGTGRDLCRAQGAGRLHSQAPGSADRALDKKK